MPKAQALAAERALVRADRRRQAGLVGVERYPAKQDQALHGGGLHAGDVEVPFVEAAPGVLTAGAVSVFQHAAEFKAPEV